MDINIIIDNKGGSLKLCGLMENDTYALYKTVASGVAGTHATNKNEDEYLVITDGEGILPFKMPVTIQEGQKKTVTVIRTAQPTMRRPTRSVSVS